MEVLFEDKYTPKEAVSFYNIEIKVQKDDDLLIIDYISDRSIYDKYLIELNLITGDFMMGRKSYFSEYLTKEELKLNDFNGLSYFQLLTHYEIIKLNNEKLFSVLKKVMGDDYFFCTSDIEIENTIYGNIVKYHLIKKGIKWHDNVYNDITSNYPLKKYLKLNDNKFLPAVLEKLKIKNKLFISVLSNRKDETHFNVLLLFKSIFGDSYIDYLHKFNWQKYISYPLSKIKHVTPLTKKEKNVIISALNSSNNYLFVSSHIILETLYKLITTREFLLKNKIKVKIVATNFDDLIILLAKFTALKKQLKIGYKRRIIVPLEMVSIIEQPIEHEGNIYYPKLLLNESDFIIESTYMGNCISKLFNGTLNYYYLSLRLGNERINLQYKNGVLIQSRARFNKDTPKHFLGPIVELTDRIINFKDIKPNLEKFDYI